MPELICSADNPRWLEERRKGVTATDITVITGLSPDDSAYSLYWKKLGQIPDEHTDTPRLRLGRELEPIIINRWQETNPDWYAKDSGTCLYRSTARPWQMATPDRTAWEMGEEQPVMTGVLEVKSWADWDRDAWADGPPARVRAQVLWQMDTLDVAVGHVGVLFLPSGEFRPYTIEHTVNCPRVDGLGIGCTACPDIDLLRSAGRDFMDRLDLNDPPSPDASSATLAALKARFADPARDKEADIDGKLWEQFDFHAEQEAIAKEHKREAEAQIREQAGQARILTVAGARVAVRVTGDQQVKAHTRHVDYIRRTASRGEDSE